MAQKKSTTPRVRKSEKAQLKRKLAIDVVWSDIKTVEADVLLVGHYLGVLPQTAERKLDELVSGTDGSSGTLIITELTRRAALRGDLGEVVFFPTPQGRVVALGGMGPVGTFRAAQVRILARAVGQVVGLLPAHRVLATVLIGSGKGNLKIREAAMPFLEGFADALNGDEGLKLDRLKIVEYELDRALEILTCIEESAKRLNAEPKDRRIVLEPCPTLVDGDGGRIPGDFGCAMMLAVLAQANRMTNPTDTRSALDTVLAQLPSQALQEEVRNRLSKAYPKDARDEAISLRDLAMTFRLREPDADDTAIENASRVAFWRSDNDVFAAAITNTTTVTELAIPNRAPLVEQGLERLQNPDPDSLTERAASLYRLLVPRELKKDVLERTEPLVIEVDRTLTRVQWEALPTGPDATPLGLARSVARQLRTFYSPRPFQPVTRPGLKALVIGDPGGPRFALDKAREEALQVAEVLKKNGVKPRLLVGAPEDGTGAGELPDVPPADYFEIVDLLLEGEFDIVHYSGHATFDPLFPDRTGWVFKAGVLTAHELEGMERPPRLVVANACLSSQVSQQAGTPSDARRSTANSAARSDFSLVASLADEFFKQGVSDYIGVAWEIPSDPAKLFAEKFYQALLEPGGKIGPALLRARKALHERKAFGTAWAAYQHYGDPMRSVSSGSS